MNTKVYKELEKDSQFLKSAFARIKVLPEDLQYELKLDLAKNEATPIEILELLIKEESEEIKVSVLKLNAVSDKIIQTALKDENANVRLTVLKEEEISENDLFALFTDPCPEVVALARKIFKSKL